MRHLRQRGYNADLICSNEFDHFLPQADTFENTYLDSIKEFDLDKQNILESNRYLINKYFFKYDFIIACGPSIAYLTYANVRIDIVIPYGSDLYNLPFFEVQQGFNHKLEKWRIILANNQKKGIEYTSAVIIDNTSDDFEKVLDKFELKGTRYKYPCPFIFTPEFSWKNAPHLQGLSSFSSRMREIRNKYGFIAFSHIRQCWKNPPDIWCYKGNDHIFRAFKEFLNKTSANACLIVFEYGTCIQDSKELVAELNLENNVIWFPLMQRKDILTMISFVDVGIGEIGNFSWFSYGAIYEFLCMKKPVIHRRDDEMYKGKVDSFYPMYSAANEEQVARALMACYNNKHESDQIADEAHNWYMANAIAAPIEVIIKVINNKNWRFYGIKKVANSILAALLSIPLLLQNFLKSALPLSILNYIRKKRLAKS